MLFSGGKVPNTQLWGEDGESELQTEGRLGKLVEGRKVGRLVGSEREREEEGDKTKFN